MTGVHPNAMRVGKRYFLINYGEKVEFEVVKRISEENFLLKDLTTLEHYQLSQFSEFGIGKDFEIREI